MLSLQKSLMRCQETFTRPPGDPHHKTASTLHDTAAMLLALEALCPIVNTTAQGLISQINESFSGIVMSKLDEIDAQRQSLYSSIVRNISPQTPNEHFLRQVHDHNAECALRQVRDHNAANQMILAQKILDTLTLVQGAVHVTYPDSIVTLSAEEKQNLLSDSAQVLYKLYPLSERLKVALSPLLNRLLILLE